MWCRTINQLNLLAGEVCGSDQGSFSVKIPSSFNGPARCLCPAGLKTNGDPCGDTGRSWRTINLRSKPPRHGAVKRGKDGLALQGVKRKGYNLDRTPPRQVKRSFAAKVPAWPRGWKSRVTLGHLPNDQSRIVKQLWCSSFGVRIFYRRLRSG